MSDRIELKADLSVDSRGTIEGIAWPYKSPDRVGDIIVKGAVHPLTDDLPMLRQHDTSNLIGVWDEIKETDDGLLCKGHFNETSLAKGTRSQIKTGRLNGLSIGFYARDSEKHGRFRVIKALDLFEISVCRAGVHPGAKLTNVKAVDQATIIAASLQRAAAVLKYDPDQVRDNSGRWGSGGGSGDSYADNRERARRAADGVGARHFAASAVIAALTVFVATGAARRVALTAVAKFGASKIPQWAASRMGGSKKSADQALIKLLDSLTDDEAKRLTDDILKQLSDDERRELLAELSSVTKSAAAPLSLADAINRAAVALQLRT